MPSDPFLSAQRFASETTSIIEFCRTAFFFFLLYFLLKMVPMLWTTHSEGERVSFCKYRTQATAQMASALEFACGFTPLQVFQTLALSFLPGTWRKQLQGWNPLAEIPKFQTHSCFSRCLWKSHRKLNQKRLVAHSIGFVFKSLSSDRN